MIFCGKCGTQIEDGAKFCPACGAPAGAPAENATAPNAEQNDYNAKVQAFTNATGETDSFDTADVQQNKVMAVLSYLGILVLIPIFAAKDSKFARYHSNQGLVLFISEFAFSILYSIINAILMAINFRLAFISSILSLVFIVFFIFAILGIVNAATGKTKELPIIGKIRILK